MDGINLPKGQSKEKNGDGRPINLPGVYFHKDSDTKFVTSDGDEGILQADALNSPVWNNGWTRIGDVPTRTELLELQKAQEIKDAKEEKRLKDERKAEIDSAVSEVSEKTYTPKLATSTAK